MIFQLSVPVSFKVGYRVVWCLAVCMFAAEVLPAQVGDLLDKLLSSERGGRIENVEAIGDRAEEATLRVTYAEIEEPGGVQVTARFLDIRLRTLDGFDASPITVDDSAGVADLPVYYAGDGSVTTSSAEVRLEKGGKVLAKKIVPLVRLWRSPGSGLGDVADSLTGGDDGEGDEGSGSQTSGPAESEVTEVVIDPIPLGDTPTGDEPVVAGGGTSGGGRPGGSGSSGGAGVGGGVSGSSGNTGVIVGTYKPKILIGLLAPQVGYLWANQQTAARYTPPAGYAYNSTGGKIQTSRGNVGSYGIQFEKLAANASKAGSLQVTSYGAAANRCQVHSWNSYAAGVQGSIRCTDVSGRAADAQFTTLSAHGLGADRIGYVLVDTPATRSYPLNGRYAANAGGSPVAVTRNSQGSFSVRFPGLVTGSNRGNVQVTSKGAAGEQCKLGGWSVSNGALVANVRCFAANGRLADARFSLLAVVGSKPGNTVGYTLTKVPGNASHTPSGTVSQSPGAVAVQRTGTGTYSVRFGGFGATRGGTVQVTAVGLDSNWCKVRNWGAGKTDFSANVLCFRASGQPADSAFSMLVVR